jgi:hypothetical protein
MKRQWRSTSEARLAGMRACVPFYPTIAIIPLRPTSLTLVTPVTPLTPPPLPAEHQEQEAARTAQVAALMEQQAACLRETNEHYQALLAEVQEEAGRLKVSGSSTAARQWGRQGTSIASS